MKAKNKQDLLAYYLDKMLQTDRELYEKILDTQGFSYYFNNICNLARDRFDLLPDEVDKSKPV